VHKAGYREARGIQPEAEGKEVVIELEEAGQIEARVVEKGSGREIPTFVVKVLLAQDAFGRRKRSVGSPATNPRRK
jgi:hypothetical protein